ncbi:DUF3566 domain-containing protein [Cellulomonas cellasea]|uniref:DUF3566 domain-containing protein n=1 Tax=Cellulomonas cellasea TaxID=43670 RepID=UPI0025A3E950|nr:DUF3566 domain-containing protein [Cellulomonas cellasea]MDM8085170.1 DUF3566 domain-containing protein [Cellulomonas cellasea]
MSSDSVPPSIPPRKRAVTPSSRPPAKGSGAAKGNGATGDATEEPRQGATSPASNGQAAAADRTPRPAGSPRPAAAKVEADAVGTAPGAAYAPTATREPVNSNGSESAARDSGPGAVAPDDNDEPPSPLQVAVDSVTTSLKKAAAATSAAFSSATHPRPKDDTMSSTTSAANDQPDTGAYTAAEAPRSTPQRPSVGRPTTIPAPGAPRRVRLAVSRVDPWSVMKLSFLLSVAIGIMIVVAAAVIWFTLDGLNVFTQIDTLVKEVLGAESDVNVLQYVEFQRIISAATLVAVVDVFLLTALSTIGAFLYNITASLVGGVHLTLTDE